MEAFLGVGHIATVMSRLIGLTFVRESNRKQRCGRLQKFGLSGVSL